jgi:hypothetical protein
MLVFIIRCHSANNKYTITSMHTSYKSSQSRSSASLNEPPLKKSKTSESSNGVNGSGVSIPVEHVSSSDTSAGYSQLPQTSAPHVPCYPVYPPPTTDAKTPPNVGVIESKANAACSQVANKQQPPQTSNTSALRTSLDDSTLLGSELPARRRVITTEVTQKTQAMSCGDLTQRHHYRNSGYFVCRHGSDINFNTPLDRIADDDSHTPMSETLDNVFRLLHLSVLVVLLFTLLLMCREVAAF